MIIFPKKLGDKLGNAGTAAIEFAILFPFLLLMFFGSFEVSRYILVVRKVENVSNDIGFLLSREGTIHDIDGDGSVNSTREDAARLERMAKAAIPMLMAPYKTNNYEMEIRAIARPKNAVIAPDNARLMWSHKITVNNGGVAPAEVSPSSDFQFRQSTSNVSGSAKPSTIYSDTYGDRTELVFPGQTFLLTNFAYGYDQIINNFINYVKLDFRKSDIEKLSTYAVRSRWFDNGDEIIQANEFYNQMQICTKCNTYQSDNVTGAAGQACVEDVGNSGHAETSGCQFN